MLLSILRCSGQVFYSYLFFRLVGRRQREFVLGYIFSKVVQKSFRSCELILLFFCSRFLSCRSVVDLIILGFLGFVVFSQGFGSVVLFQEYYYSVARFSGINVIRVYIFFGYRRICRFRNSFFFRRFCFFSFLQQFCMEGFGGWQ